MSEPWNAWGNDRPALSDRFRRLLRTELGKLTPAAPVPMSAVELTPSRLPADIVDRLARALGDTRVHTDDESRIRHAGGQSYVDLLSRRRGDIATAPDAVVVPAGAQAVAETLDICSRAGVAVVPWGGGTSVVGGVGAEHGAHDAVIAVDLRDLDQLVAVDATSLTATFQAGVRTPAAEAMLAESGLALGHLPQSYERATLGGYVVTRSAGQASTGHGRIDDLVVGLRMATPVGELVLPTGPASAAGPDLRRLVLGSEGTLGIVTEVTLHVRHRPQREVYEGWMLPSWEHGQEVLRSLAQDGPLPDVARLSDHDETRVSLAMSGGGRLMRRALAAYLGVRGVAGGCLLIAGFDGNERDVEFRRDVAREAIRRRGGVPLGGRAGRSWQHGRFAGPHLRDTLLDEGVLAETLETAATWSALPGLYAAVRAALQTSFPRVLVGCHLSHVYATGASLYFTVLATATPGQEVEQWLAAKKAANDAIVGAGGTITHHHAVGTAHRDHVQPELSDVGIEALRAVKARLDPAGILNPGKLLP